MIGQNLVNVIESLYIPTVGQVRLQRIAWMEIMRVSSKKLFLMVLVIIVTATIVFPVFAFEKTGTTAAAFLQIPIGARLPAMGNAGVALAAGPEGLLINPASAWTVDGVGLSVAHTEWFADLQHQQIAVRIPYNRTVMFGLSILSFSGDPIEQTTIEQQEGTGIEAEYGDIAVGFSSVGRVTDRFVVGGTAKYIHQKLFNETASTIGFDIGTRLETALEGFTIGMAMTNLGGEMQLEGRDLYTEEEENIKYETSKWPLPLMFRTGIGWRLLGNDYAFVADENHAVTIAVDALHINEGITTLHAGVEYGFGNTIFLRAGRTFEHDTEEWAFGAGVRINIYKYTVITDFAYADLGDLDAVQRINFTLLQR